MQLQWNFALRFLRLTIPILLLFSFLLTVSCNRKRGPAAEEDIDETFERSLSALTSDGSGLGRTDCGSITNEVEETQGTCQVAKQNLYAGILDWARGRRDYCKGVLSGRSTYGGKTNPKGPKCETIHGVGYRFVQQLTMHCANAVHCEGWGVPPTLQPPIPDVPPPTTALTACSLHPGHPYPWEGSGACTGNLMTSIPVYGSPYSLVHNSHDASTDYGFGKGFRLSIDRRIKMKSATELVIQDGDGSAVAFARSGETWTSSNLSLNRNTLVITPTEATETTRMGVVYKYRAITAYNAGIAHYALIRVTTTGSSSLHISRGEGGKINSVVDNLGRGINLTYENGKAAKVRNHGGYEQFFTYSPNLTESSYYPEGTGGLPGLSDIVTWQIRYSGELILSVVDPISGEYKYEYHSQYPTVLSAAIGPLGHRTEFTYENKRITSRVQTRALVENFNDAGQLISSTADNLTANYTRNNFGQVLSSTDHFGRSASFTYDSALLLKQVNTSAGTRIVLERTDGDVTKQTVQGPAASFVTTYTYDRHRLATVTAPGGNTVQLTYDDKGNLIKSVENGRTRLQAEYAAPQGLVSKISLEANSQNYQIKQYDSLGRPGEIVTPIGSYALSYGEYGVGGFMRPTEVSGPGTFKQNKYDGLDRDRSNRRFGPRDRYIVNRDYIGDTETVNDSFQRHVIKRNHEVYEVEVADNTPLGTLGWLVSKMTVVTRRFLRGD